MERYWALSAVQAVERFQCRLSELSESTLPVFMEFFWDVVTRTSNFNTVYRRINEMYDMLPVSSSDAVESMLDAMMKQSRSKDTARKFMTSHGRATIVSELFIVLFCPGVQGFEEAVRRMECSDNMQRLMLALLLYQHEHGKLADENWAVQIEKYLGEKPEPYLSCPSNPAPKGETTYAMVQYGDDVPNNLDTILLVELATPFPFAEAIIFVDEVLERKRTGTFHSYNSMNTVYRNGAVRNFPYYADDRKLRRSLGREVDE
jgi:hypothetical protein